MRFFRTSAPFSKITRNLVAPNGKPERIEILCDGQQVVVDGIHPGTRKPYACHKVPLGEIPHDDLPYIDEERAKELIDKIAERLIAEFGYRRGQEHPKARRRDGQGSGGATDWSSYLGNLHDHDTLVAFAMALVRSGMADGAAVNFLRSQVANLEGIDPGQRQRRLKEIPGMVASARAKLDAEVKPPDPPPSPPTKLDALVKVFEKWLLLDDPGPIYVMLGAIVANYCRTAGLAGPDRPALVGQDRNPQRDAPSAQGRTGAHGFARRAAFGNTRNAVGQGCQGRDYCARSAPSESSC